MLPELVPEFVSKTKSCVPLVVIVAAADPVPTTTSPDPFGDIAKSILVSPPFAAINGSLPVAAFVILTSFTAEEVAVSYTHLTLPTTPYV